jgi:hypothetical protein
MSDLQQLLNYVLSYRVESCRKAINRSQGMVLFGSKLKLVPLEVNGKCSNNVFYMFIPGPYGEGKILVIILVGMKCSIHLLVETTYIKVNYCCSSYSNMICLLASITSCK